MVPDKRGRKSVGSQVAAVERVVSLKPQQDRILLALDGVIGSATFRSSKRAQEFLRYIVTHSLHGDLDGLKERCIGQAVFGRIPDYDTGADAVVRVTANDVRKRLEHYYLRDNPSDPVRFALQPGGYVPEVHLVEPAQTSIVFSEPPFTEPLRHLISWRWAAIGGWSAAMVVTALWLFHGLPSRPPRELRVLPWTALFGGGQSPQLVLADSGAGSLLMLQDAPISLEDYANRKFQLPDLRLSPPRRDIQQMLARARYTSAVDAAIAGRFSILANAAGRTANVRFARDLQLADFHRGWTFILLGAMVVDPWENLFDDQMNFSIQYDSAQFRQYVKIKNAGTGSAEVMPTSVTSGMTGHAYAILSLLDGLDGKGKVLIAAGTNLEGTELAGDLMFDPDRLSGILRGCGLDPGDPDVRFEILLRLNATAYSTQGSQVLATRCGKK